MFAEWAEQKLDADERAGIIERYLKEVDFGEVQRIGRGNSVFVGPERPTNGQQPASSPHVLVLGRHDVDDLEAGDPDRVEASLLGPGTASRFGPTIAFAEGALAARTLVGDGSSFSLLSLGTGDSFEDINSVLTDFPVDAVYITNAVAWSPHHPTLTVGSRGGLVVQLTLDAGNPVDDYTTSGAFRNPLTKMVQMLGTMRGADGRITIPGFYDRAHPPEPAMRSSLYNDGHDPNEWAAHMHIARPEGGLSSLERATMWPGISVLSIDHDHGHGYASAAPASVTATVAVYLVPDQRPVEIERAVRDWFLAATPDDLRPTLVVRSSNRPWRCDPEAKPVASQALAALRIHGRRPILVPGGGAAGAGEVAFALDAPIAFAGIAPPSRSLGTRYESLSWSHFDAGVELAAQTCLQLRRI